MERYQEALADFDRAIALDEKDARAIARRGQTYRQMERYQEALADFDRAIALDEKDASIIAGRGETYRQMGRYQEALADFDRAIALDEKEDWYLYCRAQTYMLIGQTRASESESEAAIELAQLTLHNMQDNRNTSNYWRVAFNLALYHLAAGKLVDAESQYDQLASTCSLLPQLQAAANDLADFSTTQLSNELAQRIRTQLQTRIAELQQSRTA